MSSHDKKSNEKLWYRVYIQRHTNNNENMLNIIMLLLIVDRGMSVIPSILLQRARVLEETNI